MENIMLNREASIFCVDQDIEEAQDSNMSEMTIDCGNSSGMTSLGFGNDPQVSDSAEINNSINDDQGDISNNDAASVLMGEDGGMYQFFPISEREMFIVSLDDHPNLIASNTGIGSEILEKESRIKDGKPDNKEDDCAKSLHSDNTVIVSRGEINLNDKPICVNADQHLIENKTSSFQSNSEKKNFHVLTPGSQFQNIDVGNKPMKIENNDKSFHEKEEKVSFIINSKYIEKSVFGKNETKDNYIINYRDSTIRNKEGNSSMLNNSIFHSKSIQPSAIEFDKSNMEPSVYNQLTHVNNNESFISLNEPGDLHSNTLQTSSQSFNKSHISNMSQHIHATSLTPQPSSFASNISDISYLTSTISDKSISSPVPSTSETPYFTSNIKCSTLHITKDSKSPPLSSHNSQSTFITSQSSKYSNKESNNYPHISQDSSNIPRELFDHESNSKAITSHLEIPSHILSTTPTSLKVSKISLSSPLSSQDGSNPIDVGNLPVLEWFKCHICLLVLPSSLTLRHHLIHQHQLEKIEAHVCFLCSMECWSLAQLECHLRIHHGVRNATLTCHVCGTQLASVTECRAHTRKHDFSLSCPLCPEKFCAQHQLFAHVRDFHLPIVRPHLCIVCGKRFKHSSTLKLHRWRHSMQVCPQENCTYKVVDESWLVEHLQRHHKLLSQIVSDTVDRNDKADKQADQLYTNYQHFRPEKEELSKHMEVYIKDLDHTVGDQLFQNKESNNILTKNYKERHEEFFQKDNLTINSFLNDESVNYLGFKNESIQLAPTYIDPEVNNTVVSLVESIVRFEEKSNKNNQTNSLQREKDRRKLENTEEELIDKILCEESNVYRCGLCNIYLESAEELEKHKMTHEQVSCTRCNKNFKSRKLMLRHLATHAGQEHQNKDYPFACLECQKSFASKSALSRHSKIHSKSLGRFQCPECKRRMKTRSCLTEHLARVHKIYSEAVRYHCSMCNKKFTSQIYLEQHMLCHREGSTALWNCNKCDHRFQRPKALYKHLASHDKMHKCPNCQKQFTHIKKLTSHMRSHHPDLYERHECVECDLKFSYKSQLLIHLRTHTDERPYICENCGKCFKRLQHCQVHYRIAHSNIKNICPECGKTFTDKDNLMRHRLMVHYKLKRWICGICALHYAYPQDLRNHLKKQHNWVLDRVQGTNKKSRDQPVVVPELGEYQLSAEAKLRVMKMYEEVSKKIRHLVDSQTVILRNTTEDEDPDDPAIDEDNVDLGSEVTGSVIADKEEEKNVETSSQTIVSDLTSDGVVGCSSGGETACVICQVSLCCERHMEVHMVRQHRLLFQCSLCGLNYASQQLCVDHVAAQHPNHVLALQAGNMIQQSGAVQLQEATGIATLPNFMTQQSTGISSNVNSSILASTAVLPSQLCLVQQQNGEIAYCLVQPQTSQQVPIWIGQTPHIVGEQPSVETTFMANQGAIGGLGAVFQLNGNIVPVGNLLSQRNVGQMSIIGGQVIGNHGNVVGSNQQQGLYITTAVQNAASVVGGSNAVLQYPVSENLRSSLSLLPAFPVAATSSAIIPAISADHTGDHTAATGTTSDTQHQTHSPFKHPIVITPDEQQQQSLCKSHINLHDKQSLTEVIETIHKPSISISENSSFPTSAHSTEVLNEFLTSNDKETKSHNASQYRHSSETPLFALKAESNPFEQPEKSVPVFDSLNHAFGIPNMKEGVIVTPPLLLNNSIHSSVESSKEREQISLVSHVIKGPKETNSETSTSQTFVPCMTNSTAGALLTLAETCSNPSSVFGIQTSSRSQPIVESDNSVKLSNVIKNETKKIIKAKNAFPTPSSFNSKEDVITSTGNKKNINYAFHPKEAKGRKTHKRMISDDFDTERKNSVDTHNIQVLKDSTKCNPEQDLVLEIIQTNTKHSPEKSSRPHKKDKKKKSANYNFWRNQSEAVVRGLNQNRSSNEQGMLKYESTVTLRFDCQTCGKKFNTAGQLERHGKIHREKRFPCEECGKTFTENFNLKTHMMTHTKERPHQCSFCSKSFRYQRDLSDHKKTHQGIRPHECKECQRTFIRRRELLRHVRELHENQRYKCHVCGQTFLRKVYLELVHLPTHELHKAGATNTCVICKKNFLSARALKEHTAEHDSKEKQTHLCGICGRNFSKARYLTSHLRVHHKRKNYVRCSFCPRMFTSEITLKIHEDAFHINHGKVADLNESSQRSQQEAGGIMQDFCQVQLNEELSGSITSSGRVQGYESAHVSIVTGGDQSFPIGHHMLSSGHHTVPVGNHVSESEHHSIPVGNHISSSGHHMVIDGQHVTPVEQHTSNQHACLSIGDTNMQNLATISVTNISNAASISAGNINHFGAVTSTNIHNSIPNNVHINNECNSIDYFAPSLFSPPLLEKQS
ncbi:unnamed protein product [Meganyctiphanes norvegica]|uniref:C2H2-type domain-containing protein n=1 Tax=Meganyctiphanes norvegica TaxID=48144 RepID=A0AAV2RE84_MEGNR